MDRTHLRLCDLWVDGVGRYMGWDLPMECGIEISDVVCMFELIDGRFDDGERGTVMSAVCRQ